MRPVLVIATALLVNSCCATVPLVLGGEAVRAAQCRANYDEPDWTSATRYPVRVDMITATGVRVTTSGFHVNPQQIDARFADAEACLGVAIERCALDVIVAPDELPIAAGIESMAACPPGWVCAGAVQQPHSLVVTENLSSLVHEICHVVLRRADHADPRFAEGGCCR